MTVGTDAITELLEPVLGDLGYELVGAELVSAGGRQVLRLYIDSPAGVALQDCEVASRQVSAVLDVEDPISGAYTLEVSSPGLDRPIFKAADYDRFRGERVRIRLREPLEGRRRFKGELGGLEGDHVVVRLTDGGEARLPLASIDRARLDREP